MNNQDLQIIKQSILDLLLEQSFDANNSRKKWQNIYKKYGATALAQIYQGHLQDRLRNLDLLKQLQFSELIYQKTQAHLLLTANKLPRRLVKTRKRTLRNKQSFQFILEIFLLSEFFSLVHSSFKPLIIKSWQKKLLQDNSQESISDLLKLLAKKQGLTKLQLIKSLHFKAVKKLASLLVETISDLREINNRLLT